MAHKQLQHEPCTRKSRIQEAVRAWSLRNALLLLACWLVTIVACQGGVQVAVAAAAAEAEAWDNGETFSEDLFLRPLSDGKVLSHFYFKNSVPNLGSAAHHHVFPKAISQLARKFSVVEMELSFTQGRWDYERWGALDPIASSNAKPFGVELWASFDVTPDQVDPTWRNLTHALSGLFCASINFLESPALVGTPEFAFIPDSRIPDGSQSEPLTRPANSNDFRGWLRYGALSREAVCTENLTPWLKLLPCRDKAGISFLLDRPSIYKGHYHSLRVRLQNSAPAAATSQIGTAGQSMGGAVLEQTLTLVLQPGPALQSSEESRPPAKVPPPSWSLSSMFGKPLQGSCPLAKSSHVLLEIEGALLQKLLDLNALREEASTVVREEHQDGRKSMEEVGKRFADDALMRVSANPAFDLSPAPTRIFSEDGKSSGPAPSVLLDYPLDLNDKSHSLDLGMSWKERMSWPSVRGPFRVSRFLAGSGNEKGAIVIQLRSNHEQRSSLNQHTQVVESVSASDGVLGGGTGAGTVEATIFHIVPWYLRLYTHTLTAIVDGHEVPLREVVTRLRVSPAEDRLSPAVLEIQLRLSVDISVLSLTVEFDKGFLHIDEHPPDANRGFDLPSALIRFPMSQTRREYRGFEPTETASSPFKSTLQAAGPVHIYSESLMVPLATPDFSMPYNVITFTCTILALYFGSILNTLRRRVGEEERSSKAPGQQGGLLRKLFSRFMEGKSERKKKLIKVGGIALVAVIAVAVNQFSSMDASSFFKN